jgi:hypothetical protein
MPSKKVSSNRYEKPEPHDEDEYREGIHQEISKGEAFMKEEHFRLLYFFAPVP